MLIWGFGGAGGAPFGEVAVRLVVDVELGGLT